jgi:hypothetical protein
MKLEGSFLFLYSEREQRKKLKVWKICFRDVLLGHRKDVCLLAMRTE